MRFGVYFGGALVARAHLAALLFLQVGGQVDLSGGLAVAAVTCTAQVCANGCVEHAGCFSVRVGVGLGGDLSHALTAWLRWVCRLTCA